MANLLGITATDVRKKLNIGNVGQLFQIGAGPNKVPAADVEEVIEQYTEKFLSNAPDRYVKLLTHCDGVVLCRYASGGEAEFTFPLSPVSNVVLYRNYPISSPGFAVYKAAKPYRDRTPEYAMAADQFTVNGATATLVEPLSIGESLIADFDHEAASGWHQARMIILNYAAAEILKRLPTSSENISDKIESWEEQARRDLFSMDSDGRGKSWFWDRIEFVPESETVNSAQSVDFTSPLGGLL